MSQKLLNKSQASVAEQAALIEKARLAALNDSQDPDVYQIEPPIERIMMLFGDKYSLQILDLLLEHGQLRFVALESQVTGISPRTLSQRLKHLERYGLIKRHQYPSIPPRVEYEVTEKTLALLPIIDSFRNWADTWFPYCPA